MKKLKKLWIKDDERFFNFLLIVVLIIAFLLRFPGIFSNLTGEIRLYVNVDESGILKSAFNIIRTADFNPHNFTYPSFLIYLEVFFQVVVYMISVGADFYIRSFETTVFPAAHLYALGRLLNVILGTTTIFVLYKLTNQILNRKIAILAAAILGVTFAHIWSSQYAVTDVPVTLWGLIAVYFSIRILKQDTWKNYLLAAIFIGLALGTKYNAFTFFIPFFFAHLFKTQNGLNKPSFFNFLAKFFNKKFVVALVLVPLVYLAVVPYTILDIQKFIRDYTAVVASNNSLGSLNVQLTDVNGIPSWLWYILYSATSGLYYPIFLSVVLGLFWGVLTLTKEKSIILSYVVVNYFVISQMSGRMDRWIIHTYPYLSILAAIFIYDLGAFLLRKRTRFFNYLNSAIFLVILVAVFGLSILRAGIYNWSILKKDTRIQVNYWIVQNLPKDKFVFSVDNAFSFDYLSRMGFTDLHGGVVLGDRALKEIMETPKDRYVVFQSGYLNALNNFRNSEKRLSPYWDSQSFKELSENYQILEQKAQLIKEISDPYFKSGFFGPYYLEQSSTVTFWHNPTILVYYLPAQ